MTEVESLLKGKQELIHGRRGELNSHLKQEKIYVEEIVSLEKLDTIYEKVVVLFNDLGEKQQQVLRRKIESIVSYGLKVVFDEDYRFIVNMEVKGKQVVMDFALELRGFVEEDIMASDGGGVVAIIGFILRLLVVIFLKGRVRQLIIMDEALAQLSSGYRSKMAEFVKELASRIGIQMIIVSHQDEYLDVADKAYRFTLDEKGHTVVKELVGEKLC